MSSEVAGGLAMLSATVPGLDLPIGIYLVSPDGGFIECNRRAREILGLPASGPIEGSIAARYVNGDDRRQLLTRVQEAEAIGRYLEGVHVRFQVGGRHFWVQDYCRSVRDPVSGAVVAYLGCLSDVDDDSAFVHFFERLPKGLYRLDRHDRIEAVNSSVARILRYPNADALKGKCIEELYVDPSRARELRQKLETEGYVDSERCELKGGSGEPVYVEISAFKLVDELHEYAGREGTVTDVTAEENYRQILDNITIGTYMIEWRNGRHEVVECNDSFARIFGFASSRQMIGQDILERYVSPQRDFPPFEDALREAAKEEKPLLKHRLQIRREGGGEATVEVSTRGYFDQSGMLTKRIGVIRDVTNQVALETLRDDICRIIHVYKTALLVLWYDMLPVLDVLGPDPFAYPHSPEGHYISEDAALAALRSPCRQLLVSLTLPPTERRRIEELSKGTFEALSNARRYLSEALPQGPRSLDDVEDVKYLASEILRVAHSGLADLGEGTGAALSAAAREAGRLTSLMDVHAACDMIAQASYEVSALLQHLESDSEFPGERKVCAMETLVSRSLVNLRQFARSRRVRFRYRLEGETLVCVRQQAVLRALGNLLHNAIKYSWERKLGEPRWVGITMKCERSMVDIEIANYGVPIRRDELDSGVLFRFGTRGDLADDRWRTGTGMGLSDARRVAREHGGDVTIDSVPANRLAARDNYREPFVTTATLSLPVHEREVSQHADQSPLD